MTEATLTKQILIFLSRKPCFAIKHADFGTIGLPDMSVSAVGKTTWVEVKYVRPGQKLLTLVKGGQAQLATMCRLEKHAAHAIYWIYYGEPRDLRWEMWLPNQLMLFLKSDGHDAKPYLWESGHGHDALWEQIIS